MLAIAAQAESPVLTQARRALAEDIPLIAIQNLTTALATNGIPAEERPSAQELLAEAQIDAKLPDDALKTLSESSSPGGTSAMLLRAQALTAANRWAEALPIYQSLSDSNATAAIGEAESLQYLGHTTKAVDSLKKLVASGRATPSARLRLASLLVEQNHASAAREMLKSVSAVTATEALWAKYIDARILLAEKKPQAALAILEPMLKLVDGHPAEGFSANLYAAATLAHAEATLTPENPEQAAKILETYIRVNFDSPLLELMFRRLDQIYAMDKSPTEQVLHSFIKELPPRASALARFYVCKMQFREKRFSVDHLPTSIRLFLKSFPGHPLTPQIHEMEARLALATATPAAMAQALNVAEEAYEAGSLAAKTPEVIAEFALRTALVNLQQGKFVLAANRLNSAKESTRLRESAMFNTALAWLMQANHDKFSKELDDFKADFAAPLLVGQLRLEQALVKARSGDKTAVPTIEAFLRDFPEHPRRGEARLAAAELAFRDGRQDEAETLVQAAAEKSSAPETLEQSACFAIFLEDAKKPRDNKKVIELSRGFISKYPKSQKLGDVRMKLGEVYFHGEDFLNAQEQFEVLAREQPDGEYTERALYLAGQCGMSLISVDNLGHALQLFDKVAERKGQLEANARLQQAIIKYRLGLEEDAVKLYDTVLGLPAAADPEIHYAALIGKGGTLAKLAQKLPTDAPPAAKTKFLTDAIGAYDTLLAHKDISPAWRNQALYWKGKRLLELDRNVEALAAFNDVLEMTAADGERKPPTVNPPERFWFAKAGFDAAGHLETMRDWRAAITFYTKMANVEGPHAELAKKRIKEIRLEQFLFD